MRSGLVLACIVTACAPAPVASPAGGTTALELPVPEVLAAWTGSGHLGVYVVDVVDVVVVHATTTGDGDFVVDEAEGVTTVSSVCPNGQLGCDTSFVFDIPADLALTLATLGGDLLLDGGYAGTATLSSRTGDVRGSELGAADLSITADVGDTELAFAERPVGLAVDGTVGAVTAEVPSGVYDLDLETAGPIVLTGVSPGAGPPVVVQATVGSVTLVGR